MPVAMLENRTLINPREAAQMLNVSIVTLADWRCRRTVALPFVKVGRAVKYRLADIEAFIESNIDRVGAVAADASAD